MEKISINISDEVQASRATFATVEEACKYLIDILVQRNVVVNVVQKEENREAGSEEQ